MVDKELKDLLQKNLEKSEDNNRLLNKIARVYKWQLLFTLIKWGIVLGSAFGLYYFLQPYLENIANTYLEVRQVLPFWPNNNDVEGIMPR